MKAQLAPICSLTLCALLGCSGDAAQSALDSEAGSDAKRVPETATQAPQSPSMIGDNESSSAPPPQHGAEPVGNANAPGAPPFPAGNPAGAPLDGDVAAAGTAAAGEALAPPELPPAVALDPAEDGFTVEPQEPQGSVTTSTNPFVSAKHDPLSTFAVDVDTASYDIFRREVLAGSLPAASQVRLEEFVNYFTYDYPAPDSGAEQPFSIELSAAPGLADNGATLLRVGIQGEAAPAFEKRPANLVYLVDVSGSMQSEEKLPLVKKVLTQSLTILDPEDTVSLVTYASGTEVLLEPTPVSEAETIAGVIDGLRASGSTNGAGGIQLAYEQAATAFIEGGINHVILCTDGDFNVGVSSPEGLVELIEEKRESGVTLTALGFGTSNNDVMMERVSNAGNGVYGVIANEQQAVRYVQERLLHNLVFIAKDVKIQVEFNPDQVKAYRLLGYENRAIADEDFRDDQVDAGEIGAGHRVTALYEVIPKGSAVPSPDGAPSLQDGEAFDGEVEIAAEDFVQVKVRYKDVDATAEDEAYEVAKSLTPEDIEQSHLDLDADFQWAIAVATLAEVLKSSPYADASMLELIEPIIDEQSHRDEERSEFATLFAAARAMIVDEPR